MEFKPKHDLSPKPADVPVFNCIVYIKPITGGVAGRVANLAGIEHFGANEREVLGKIVPDFKRRAAEATECGEEIEWIDPPPEPEAEEWTRFVPVHL